MKKLGMVRKVLLRVVSWILLFLLVCSDLTVLSVRAEGERGENPAEKSSLIRNLRAAVKQDGKEIADQGEIDFKKDILISVAFDFPVIGDEDGQVDADNPDTYIRGGDYAYIDLPAQLKLVMLKDVDMYFGDVKVGALTKEENGGEAKAKVVFTDEINAPEINSASASFNMTMRYDGDNDGDSDIVDTIRIYDKSFSVTIPPKATIVTAEKSGDADASNKRIRWTIRVNADREGGDSDSDGDLAGYQFIDDLSGTGDYIDGTFQVGRTEDGSDAVDRTPEYGAEKVLSYTFTGEDPDGTCTGTRYLFFETEIPDNKYYVNGNQKITNSAEFRDKNGVTEAECKGTASYKMDWISKSGEADGDGMTDGTYDPENRQIKWTVIINGKMNDAILEDKLPDGLGFVSAQEALFNTGLDAYDAPTPIAASQIETTVDGQDGRVLFTYHMGDISGLRKITIVTKIQDAEITGKKEITYKNTAQIRGENVSGIRSSEAGVTVGIATVRKNAGTYDRKSHTMNWDVVLNTAGQELGGKLRVLDLIVYSGSNTQFNVDTIDHADSGWGTPGKLTYVSKEVLKKLTPRYNQRINETSFQAVNDCDLKATVYTLTSGGKAVADLMVVTSKDDKEINAKNEIGYSYSTTVCNPDFYASNANSVLYNTASLFSADIEINSSTATKGIESHMLLKDTLSRNSAAVITNEENDADSAETIAAVNSDASSTQGSFEYIDKSVIYRIHVNANELKDVTNDVTTDSDKNLGNFKIKDVLPKGWEFKKIRGESYFLLYEGTGNGSRVNASAVIEDGQIKDIMDITGPVKAKDGSAESFAFDFKKLSGSYVILVKAGPDEETAKGYFSKLGDTTVKNQISAVENENFTIPVKSSVDTKISSSVLLKTITEKREEEEYLKWRIDYRPYDLDHEGAYIEDELPSGIELRTDASGKLLLGESGTENIRVAELELASDGNYKETNQVTLTDTGIVSYDNESRILKFTPPDTRKAYLLEYITDITGEGGMQVNNKVSLYMGEPVAAAAGQKYQISNASYGALFRRAGWFRIQKTDGDTNAFLKGAEFTLYSKEGNVIREVTTNDKGSVYLKALPDGDYILKETKAPGGYVLSDKEYQVHVEKDGTGSPQTSIDGVTAEELSIRNFLEGTKGNLLITKEVAGSGADENTEFEFTVSFKDQTGLELTGDFEYTLLDGDENIVEKGSITGGGMIRLSHGQSLMIYDLPKETKYEVTEKDYTQEGYVTSITGDDTGTIEADLTKKVVFTNIRKTGTLAITKTVGGTGGDKAEKFRFTVTLDGKNKDKAFPYKGYGVPDGEIRSGGTIELAHEQSVVIEGIAQGTLYEVEEQDYSSEGYVTTAEGQKGTISSEDAAVASFVNSRQAKEEEVPDTPEEPDVPVNPDTPEIPDVPVNPDTPKEPDTPVKPVKPEGTDHKDKNDQAGTKTDQESNSKDGKAAKAVKTGDELPVMPYAGSFAIAAGISAVILLRKKQRLK